MPADKAANSVAVVRKMYYINIQKQEYCTAKTYENYLLDEWSVVNRHQYRRTAHIGVRVDEDHRTLSTLYWLPKRNKRFYKSCYFAYSSVCTTTELL